MSIMPNSENTKAFEPNNPKNIQFPERFSLQNADPSSVQNERAQLRELYNALGGPDGLGQGVRLRGYYDTRPKELSRYANREFQNFKKSSQTQSQPFSRPRYRFVELIRHRPKTWSAPILNNPVFQDTPSALPGADDHIQQAFAKLLEQNRLLKEEVTQDSWAIKCLEDEVEVMRARMEYSEGAFQDHIRNEATASLAHQATEAAVEPIVNAVQDLKDNCTSHIQQLQVQLSQALDITGETYTKKTMALAQDIVSQELSEPLQRYADEHCVLYGHELGFFEGLSFGQSRKHETLARQVRWYQGFATAEDLIARSIREGVGPLAELQERLRRDAFAQAWHECTRFRLLYENGVRDAEHMKLHLEQGSVYAALVMRGSGDMIALTEKSSLRYISRGDYKDKTGYFGHVYDELYAQKDMQIAAQNDGEPPVDISRVSLLDLPDQVKDLIQAGREGAYDACILSNKINNNRSQAAFASTAAQSMFPAQPFPQSSVAPAELAVQSTYPAQYQAQEPWATPTPGGPMSSGEQTVYAPQPAQAEPGGYTASPPPAHVFW